MFYKFVNLTVKPILMGILVIFGSHHFAHSQISSDKLDSLSAEFDFIETNSGNILIGTLNFAVRGKVGFDIEDVGEVEINMEDIKSIYAKSSDFVLDIPRQKRKTGKFFSGDSAGYFTFQTSTEISVIKLEDIILLKRKVSSIRDRFEGNVGVGYSFSNGSGFHRINFNNQLSYTTEKDKIFQHSTIMLTFKDTITDVERVDAGLGGYYGIGRRFVLFQYFQFQRISGVGVASRFISISGAGVKLVTHPVFGLNMYSGVALHKEFSNTGLQSPWHLEIPILLDYKLGIISPDIELSGATAIYISTYQPGRVRIDGRLTLSMEIVSDLTIGTHFLYYFDNQPLAVNKRLFDFNAAVSLGYEF